MGYTLFGRPLGVFLRGLLIFLGGMLHPSLLAGKANMRKLLPLVLFAAIPCSDRGLPSASLKEDHCSWKVARDVAVRPAGRISVDTDGRVIYLPAAAADGGA